MKRPNSSGVKECLDGSSFSVEGDQRSCTLHLRCHVPPLTVGLQLTCLFNCASDRLCFPPQPKSKIRRLRKRRVGERICREQATWHDSQSASPVFPRDRGEGPMNRSWESIQSGTAATDVELAATNLAIVISERVCWIWAQSLLGAQASREA